jgi:hypothetical protein
VARLARLTLDHDQPPAAVRHWVALDAAQPRQTGGVRASPSAELYVDRV